MGGDAKRPKKTRPETPEPEATIAARRLVIGEARDWLEAAARLEAAGYQDGVIQRAKTEIAQRVSA